MGKIDLGKNARRTAKVESDHWWDMQHSLVLRQTPRWAQSLVLGLSFLGIGGIVAGFTINIDEVVNVQGRLVPAGGNLEVKSPAGGLISEVFAKEGMYVKKGQLIASFDKRRILNEIKSLSKQIETEKIKMKAAEESLSARKKVIERNYETNMMKLNNMREIEKVGALSKNAIYDQTDKVLDLKSSAEEIEQQLTSIKSSSKAQLASLENRKSSAEVELQYITVKSPTDGIVFQLKASEEAVISPGDTIAEIIPQDGVKGEVWISNKDIGFVRIGQKTDVRIAAFDYTQFGTVKGKVTAIGADVLKPDSENNQYRFPVDISLDKNFLETKEIKIPLRAGLAINANLFLRERKLITLVNDMFGSQVDSLKSLR